MRLSKKTQKSRQAMPGSKQISFLPEPEFNPIVPSRNTILFSALKLLITGRKISHRDFDKDTSSYRLAAYVYDLKKLGWPVEDISAYHRVNKKPFFRRMSIYFLPATIIAKFRKNGGVL